MTSAVAAVAVLLSGGMASCSQEQKPDWSAANAAKTYYDSLLQAKCEYFTDGHYRPEPIPEQYRSQLVDNTRMYLDRLLKEHGGLKEVQVVNCVTDTAGLSANAFLLLCYGDSTKEEIVVPMVKNGSEWQMR